MPKSKSNADRPGYGPVVDKIYQAPEVLSARVVELEKQVKELEHYIEETEPTEHINNLKREKALLQSQLDVALDIQERLKGVLKLSDPEQKQLLANGLSSMPTGGDAWMAIMLLLSKAQAIEHGAAKRPGISNDDRNFNTGRESALEDFAHILVQAKAETAREEGE